MISGNIIVIIELIDQQNYQYRNVVLKGEGVAMNLEEFILTNEKPIRMGFFFGVLAIMAVWEILAPRRQLTVSKTVRWVNNLGLAKKHGWGLFNTYELPLFVSVIASVVIMDFVIYVQHVMVHAIPVLWRLHRVHHADPDYDVTTGARFHTLEIILSMLIKFATILLLGPPVVAVILFELILNVTAMLNHGNVGLPAGLDRVLRWIVVTPDMHRVHHSVEDDEANSNFGFSLPWWDRLFGTYRDQPRGGHQGMTIGIHKYHDAKDVSWITGMLVLPFRGKISEYAINRRQWGVPDELTEGEVKE